MSVLRGNADGYVYSDDPLTATDTPVTLASIAFFEALGNYTKLASGTLANASTATVVGLPYPAMSGKVWALIDSFSDEAEIRRATIASGVLSFCLL